MLGYPFTITPAGLTTFYNQAEAYGYGPGGTYADDLSDSGANATDDPLLDGDNPDQPGDTGGTDDPTPVSFPENPSIGVAKDISSGPTSNGDGSYRISYDIRIENTGDVDLRNVNIEENLTTTFAGAG